MDDGRLSTALGRAENALTRIERLLERQQRGSGGGDELRARVREDELRARVGEAVAELDQIIRAAEG